MLRIHISKSQRQLHIYEGNVLLHQFPIGIGKQSGGPKETEGDHRTPEGQYKIICKNPQSKYHLSLGLDYPNPADAERGLAMGILSQDEYQSILDAHSNSSPIPWKTPMGGEIFIHGAFEEGDGSQGCIRMYKQDIETVFTLIPKGTPVEIVD
ncbi:MAG: hypothetical protein DHS20C10_07280 [marine bacterium B5-7]|nr:MAG: hypothetical protein DHS20C10_07280 [marine bacterium B5-7]